MLVALKKKYHRNYIFRNFQGYFCLLTLAVSACGGKKTDGLNETKIIGFSPSYVPPTPNFESENTIDPYFKTLEPSLIDPYWTTSLEMNEGEMKLDQLLVNSNRTLKFSFPVEVPSYLPVSILGWAPANHSIKASSREIFSKLEEIIDVNFEENDTPEGMNNIVISQSIQSITAGFSYFPNNFYQLGSDVFISTNYSNPLILTESLTNYDYEILVHEIGHALGLKHPFETDGGNTTILNMYEDQTKFTAMSYNDYQSHFDGTFRPLDLMTLTKLYGVKETYNAGNDVYEFDDHNGKFIIDGNGEDTVSMTNSLKNIYIDLRPGMHSYEGQKSSYITDAYQLTISHGSEIENVETGLGNDWIIGNQLANLIISNSGDDKIFAGEGMDIINSGLGKDTIDLSENIQSEDRIIYEELNKEESFDTLYGFSQDIPGDVIDITDYNFPELNFLPLIDVLNIPTGYIDYSIVRIFGEGLNNSDSVAEYFRYPGSFEGLKLSVGKKAVIIAAASQDTGEAQNIFSVLQNSNSIEVDHLTQLVGNYLDIDNWTLDNFLI